MATKIYIGNNEIAGGGGSGGGASYDSEMEVISNALVDLKAIASKEAKAVETKNELDEYKSSNDSAVAEINSTIAVIQEKFDNFYTQTEINQNLKVIAAALAQLDDRLKALETQAQS